MLWSEKTVHVFMKNRYSKCPAIFIDVFILICAPDISQTFAANSWDGVPWYCFVRWGGESFNHLSFIGSDAFTSKFFFPSRILLRVSNTTLSDQFFGYWFSIPCFRFFFQCLVKILPCWGTSEKPMKRPFKNVPFVLQRCAASEI